MKNIMKNYTLPKSQYWDLITSTLSSYEVTEVSNDGKVKRSIVNDDYFLVNDIWNVNDIGEIPNFQEGLEKYKGTNQNLRFKIKNPNIALEIKFVFYNKLFKDDLSFGSLFTTYYNNLNRFSRFIDEKHPRLNSLLDLNIDKAEKEWVWWLNKNNIKITRKRKDLIYGETEYKSPMVIFLHSVYEKLSNLTDTREEWGKDKWDIRILNEKYGIPYNHSVSQYYADFTFIKNENYKLYLKKYVKNRLLSGKNFSWGTARRYVFNVSFFLNFIVELEPDWNDLSDLKRDHIEKYLEFLHENENDRLKRKNSNPKTYIKSSLECVNPFLLDIQRFEYSIAPRKPIFKLIYSEDYPKRDKKSDDDIDYIPDYVLEQLFENLKDLDPDLQPVVWVSFKTGLRISDTLGLTQDCLIRLNGKYSIQTDIEKTYVKGHKIPIDDQLANIIAVLIHSSKERSNDDNNPEKYIFVRYNGSRKGRPFNQGWVRQKLNELAIKKNITDEVGNIFHFKIHQFRHTYAVKMLNGGADILTVQDLLAHASPEMTMRYARLLDDTKRKAFEKVVKQGVFTFDLNGQVHQVKESEEIPNDVMDMLWKNEKLNALDNPYGSCRARINGNCPLAVEPPCLTANNGKPCFDLAVGISDMDVRKYELHIESTMKMIEAAKQFGRKDMVEANENNLERYQKIYETIKSGSVIFGRFERIQKEMERNRKGAKRG
ncbi:Site-specific recombinase XerD [Bacillus sp. OV166]|uniref:tyrosine-type recombinase/integrase n=1 Tax=Bacillus sp. OV166 TaxID=1882763 RepID=UPI000A2ABE8A|nr:tyrosine-type recombinase/integrase [Bacillus sp. OV166]SMQ77500.1 Site-specific recombinase XerD [Bacillus sp. OV166]